MAICSRSCGSCSIRWMKPLPFLAQQVVGRHPHVVEEQLGGVLRLQAQLLERWPARSPACRVSTSEQARALGAALGSVLATTITRSACQPLVMKVLLPLIT